MQKRYIIFLLIIICLNFLIAEAKTIQVNLGKDYIPERKRMQCVIYILMEHINVFVKKDIITVKQEIMYGVLVIQNQMIIC